MIVRQAGKTLGINEQTYYRWCKKYGGPGMNQARHLMELEGKNSHLKKPVAKQALDTAILKETSSGS